MANPETSPAITLNDERDRTIQVLIGHFAEDRLTMEELERRLDAAHRAIQKVELDALTADLPALSPPIVQETTAPAPAPRPALQRAEAVRDREVVGAIMGGVERKGDWMPARNTYVFAIMGGVDLDFREAILPPGVSDVHIFTIWGGVEILVRPGTRVESSGIAIMAGFEHVPGPPVHDPDAPIIRVTGFALWAGVEVNVRYPNESARDASHRLRDERRRLRQDRKRLK